MKSKFYFTPRVFSCDFSISLLDTLYILDKFELTLDNRGLTPRENCLLFIALRLFFDDLFHQIREQI